MRLASFNTPNGEKTVGAFVQDCYIDLHALTNGELPNDMIALLEHGKAAMDQVRTLIADVDLDPASPDTVDVPPR